MNYKYLITSALFLMFLNSCADSDKEPLQITQLENKSSESTSAESKNAVVTQSENKSSESTPAESKNVVVTQSKNKSSESTSAESKNAVVTQSENKSSEKRSKCFNARKDGYYTNIECNDGTKYTGYITKGMRDGTGTLYDILTKEYYLVRYDNDVLIYKSFFKRD